MFSNTQNFMPWWGDPNAGQPHNPYAAAQSFWQNAQNAFSAGMNGANATNPFANFAGAWAPWMQATQSLPQMQAALNTAQSQFQTQANAFWQPWQQMLKPADPMSVPPLEGMEALKQAWLAGDMEAQKDALRALSAFWLRTSSQVVSGSEAQLRWQRESLELWIEQGAALPLEYPMREETLAYQKGLLDFMDRCAALIRVFDGLDEKVSDVFIERALAADVDIGDLKALFDCWAEVFDAQYLKVAREPAYQHAFGEWVDALATLRLGQQKIVDGMVEAVGLPSKREMDSVHGYISALRKEVRRLNRTVAELSEAAPDAPKAPLKTAPKATTTAKPGAASPTKAAPRRKTTKAAT